MDRMDMPVAIGGRECYRLSSPIAALMRNMKLDSPDIDWFSIKLPSTAIQIVYCISNTRGSSPMFDLSNLWWQEGVIKFHRNKPERDTMRWPQSRALSGLAKFYGCGGCHAL